MAFVETRDGTRLYVRDWGRGHPVVLLHGWPLDADMWEYQSVALATRGCRVVAYDRRGFGRSDQPWSGYDYDTLADDLDSVMTACDLQAATLVGFSMGGGEVARYCSRHGSGRLARAVLLAAVTPYLVQTPDNPDGVAASVFEQMLEGLRRDRPHFLAGLGRVVFGAGLLNFAVSNETLQWALGMALRASPKATQDCVRAFSGTDFRPDMAALGRLPTLVVHGGADATVPASAAGRRAAAAIPGARLIEYDGAPHALFFTEKDRLNADLLAFINA